MIKVRGLQHTCLRRPAEQVTHRTSLYPFPCPGQRGHRRLQKLPLPQQPLCSVWSMARGPREALPTPQRRAPGPESRRGSIPAHVWSHRPSREGHLLTPFDSPRLEVGKAACGRLLTPKSGPSSRAAQTVHNPAADFSRPGALACLPGGPSSVPPGQPGQWEGVPGQTATPSRSSRRGDLDLSPGCGSVCVDGSALLSGIHRGRQDCVQTPSIEVAAV